MLPFPELQQLVHCQQLKEARTRLGIQPGPDDSFQEGNFGWIRKNLDLFLKEVDDFKRGTVTAEMFLQEIRKELEGE